MPASETQEMVRTVAAVVASFSIVAAVAQFQLQLRVWRTAHERLRAEKAIEVIRHFNASVNAQSAATIRLVEGLENDQLRKLDAGAPFKIRQAREELIRAALPGQSINCDKQEILLTSEQVYQVRFQALEVLNAVEIACLAWELDVADRDAIEKELEFLYDAELPEPTTLMRDFRNAFWGERFYPALYNFIAHIEEKRPGKGKPNLVTIGPSRNVAIM